MMKSNRTLVSLTAFASIAAAASPANAASAESSVGTLQEVVVTAQKREQTMIDVPQSISVVSGAALEQQQAGSFADYLKLVPGLQLVQSSPGYGRLVLRGLNTNGVSSTVGVYLDETPFGSSSGLVNGALLAGDFDTFDISRVEVLRGPQGTLYGASSMGGVLKYVTNAPQTDRFSMRARMGVASVDGGDMSYSANGVVNIPLSSTVAFRASGTYRKVGGFIDSIGTAGSDLANNINGARSSGGRASLLLLPSEKLSFRLSAMLQNIDTNAPSNVESDPNTLVSLYGRQSQSQFVPQFGNIAYRLYNGLAKVDVGFAELTSSTSYSTQKRTHRDDATTNLSALIAAIFATPNQLYLGQNTNVKKLTQELRLASKKSDIFDWLVGAYYTHEDGLIHQQYVAVVPKTLTPITTLPLLADVSLDSTYKETAGFANATIHLGERFDIDLGGRYSRNTQDATQATAGALAGGVTKNAAKSSENVFTYSIAPKLKFGDRTAIYVRVAKGFRPGGPNVLPPAAPVGTPATYESDSVLSYEAGAKARSADGMFAIDLAAFHIDWKNIQLLAVVNGFGVNTNSGSAKSDGLEFTATLRPVRSLSLSLNGAYTDAQLKVSTSPLVGGVKGDKLPFSPKYSLGLNTDYRWAMGATREAFVGGSLRHVSTQSGAFDATFRTANGRQRELPSYDVIDLQLGLDFGKFSIEAFAKNLGNGKGETSTSAVKANGFNLYPNGAIATGVIAPRSIGLSLTAEY